MNIRRVCRKSLHEGRLDCFFGCEVGGHREGFPATCTDVETVLEKALPSDWKAAALENYLSAWNESDSGVKLENTKTVTYTLSSPSLDPSLILHTFNVRADAAQLGDSHVLGHMLVGQLHIRTPSGKKESNHQDEAASGPGGYENFAARKRRKRPLERCCYGYRRRPQLARPVCPRMLPS